MENTRKIGYEQHSVALSIYHRLKLGKPRINTQLFHYWSAYPCSVKNSGLEKT